MAEPTFPTPYEGYDVLDKWESPSFNEQTRAVLRRRMDSPPPRRFLTEHEWALMDAIAEVLIPQPDRARPVEITPWVDARLFDNETDGYRFQGMPPLREAWRKGLRGIDAEAKRRYARGFLDLDAALRNETLKAVHAGEADPELFENLPGRRFFISLLLKTVVGIYYAHPAAWSEIGFGGPASPRGYVRLALGDRDPWEAEEHAHG